MKGYVFNNNLRKIFFSLAFLFILPSLIFAFHNGFFGDGFISFSCSSVHSVAGFCENPLFNHCFLSNNNAVCHEEYVPVGFVYNPLPKWLFWFEVPLIILMALFFVLNHILFNRGVSIE